MGGGGATSPKLLGFFQNNLYQIFSFGTVIMKVNNCEILSKEHNLIIFHSAAINRINAAYMYIIQYSLDFSPVI